MSLLAFRFSPRLDLERRPPKGTLQPQSAELFLELPWERRYVLRPESDERLGPEPAVRPSVVASPAAAPPAS